MGDFLKDILVAFANPRGASVLRLDEEDRTITESIRLGKYRENFSLTKCHASTVHDLSRALLDKDYEIVQISGHGTQRGLVLESTDGSMFVVPVNALAELVSAYAPPRGQLQCVILNSCYSLSTGTIASLGVPYTIAMEGPISDNAAIEFSRGFYDAIGAGKTYEFAYEEGCRRVKLVSPESRFVSYLIQKGESLKFERKAPSRRQTSPSPTENVLSGWAIDFSGSMQSSIKNRSNGILSRLDGFQVSMENFANGAKDVCESEVENKNAFKIFAYAFGLRHKSINHADIFSLAKAVKRVATNAEIEKLTSIHTSRVKDRYESSSSQYSGLGSLARRYGYGNVVDSLADGMRKKAEQEVRDCVISDLSSRIAASLGSLGNTTLNLSELVDFWSEGEFSFDNAKELIFGRTPMCATLNTIVDRFNSEFGDYNKTPLANLFLLSDGIPTDGDPREHIKTLKEMGVIVVSCYIIDKDITNPRTIYGNSDSSWPEGAKLMFDAASPFEEHSDFTDFFLSKGWKVQPNGRLFVQINHSDILTEFMDVVLVPLRSKSHEWQLPNGDRFENPH